MTPEQYLEIERKAEHKNEYLDGQMVAMQGSNLYHNRLTRDLSLILYRQVEACGCQLYASKLTEASNKEDFLELRSIDCRVSMAELYRHIEFRPADDQQSGD